MWVDVEKMLVDHLNKVQVSHLAQKQSSLVTPIDPLAAGAPASN